MDPLESNDDEFDLEKGGIHLRLNRLIEKQTKRYESFIRTGNHAEAQQLLQIIWQLKQLRLPEVDQDTSKLAADFQAPLDQRLEPNKSQAQLPELESWLMDELEEELHDEIPVSPQEIQPQVASQITPPPAPVNTAGIAKVHTKLSMLLSNALTPDPNSPPMQILSPSMPDLLKMPPSTPAPSLASQLSSPPPSPSPPSASPPPPLQPPSPSSASAAPPLSTSALAPPPVTTAAPPSVSPPLPTPFSSSVGTYDEISTGEFDVSKEENDDIATEIFGGEDLDIAESISFPELKGAGDAPSKPTEVIEAKKIIEEKDSDNIEDADESNDYDNPEDYRPLKGLMTTGHVKAVTKEDLDRSAARKNIVWEEEEQISSGARTKPKPISRTRLRERVKIKPAKGEEDDNDDDLGEEEIKTIDEILPAKNIFNEKNKLIAGAVAGFLLIGTLGIVAFNSLNAPNFDNLEKLGEQNGRPAFEMERLYLQAVKASPNDARGWSGLSYWQGQQEGKLCTSLESQAKAIKLAPKNAKNWYTLALLLKTSSNYKESLRAANEACQLDPGNELYSSLQKQVEKKVK